MTFEELNNLCTAIWVREINFDYFAHVLKMVVGPEYGYDERIEDNTFQLIFEDCIYVCCSNTSRLAETGKTEFIVWGEHPEKSCGEGSCGFSLDDFLAKTISSGSNQFARATIRDRTAAKRYRHSYFQNVLGDAIDVLSSKALVVAVSQKAKGVRTKRYPPHQP